MPPVRVTSTLLPMSSPMGRLANRIWNGGAGICQLQGGEYPMPVMYVLACASVTVSAAAPSHAAIHRKSLEPVSTVVEVNACSVVPLDAENVTLSFSRSVYSLSDDAVTLKTMKNGDRKSTRLNSSHLGISYAVFCLKKK